MACGRCRPPQGRWEELGGGSVEGEGTRDDRVFHFGIPAFLREQINTNYNI